LAWKAARLYLNFIKSPFFATISPVVFLVLFAAFFPGHLPIGQFFLSGDSLVTAAQFKNVIQGAIFGSAQMGWPIGMYAPQFPFADFLSLSVAKLVSVFIGDPVRLYLFMIHFALFSNSISAYWCLRSFGCSRIVSLICSAVFGASFFFFVRSTVHLFFAMYLAIPVSAALAGFILGRFKMSLPTIALCGLAVALSHVYYAVAAVGLTMFALVISMMTDKMVLSYRKLFAVAAVVVPLGVVNCLLYWIVYANGLHLPVRSAGEQPALALRFVDAFVPTSNITGGMLKSYYEVRPLGEGYEYIGYLATIGLLISLVSLMRRVSPLPLRSTSALDDDFLPFFAVSTLVLVVICLPFGAGLLINLISPLIRAQNRFSIFLTFWGILCFAIFFSKLPRGWPKLIVFVLLAALTAKELSERVNLLSRSHCPGACIGSRPCSCYDEVKRTLEPVLSAMKASGTTTVLQLPFQKYPEAGPLGQRQDYFGFFPYIAAENHSPLRFSYGLTDDDLLGKYLAASQDSLRSGDNVGKTLNQLACVGYRGILIDKAAYSEADLDAVERSLGNLQREISTDTYSLYAVPNSSTAAPSDIRSERIKKSVSCFEEK
jgi:hypothetical protein